ncbi:MAG: T9SS type A sorting domain-containing protein, partial [Bacteroidia bacterium]|nr:T9SS type A sorting domain-containing protein [Bacteroidia bacterium]
YSEQEFNSIVKGEMMVHSKKISPQAFSTINDYDIKYHRFHWNVDPAVNYISGDVFTIFTTSVNGFDSIRFNLSVVMAVDSVVYHNIHLTYVQYGNSMLSAALPSALAQNVTDSVCVYYRGFPPSTGFGSFIQSTHGTPAVPVLWTLSEPYGGSDWWPCKNSLTDKVDSIDVFVTCPAGNKVASNGVLLSETALGSDRTFHWKHKYPIATYLICFACTNYEKYSDFVPFGATNLEVVNYVYPEDSASAVSQTSNIVPVMQLFDTLFGVYPFVNEKYGHAQFGWGGGMEHQTMTFMTGFGHELMAHELGHHWFGDKITCGSWQDIWLNEGFATYLSGLTYEHMFGGYWWPIFKSGRIGMVTSAPDGSVWCNDTTNVNRIFDGRLTYAKGAMILNQLRWVIGDSAFFAATNNYLNDPSFAYKFARTADLKNHFEISSGQNLTWYFNDWFTGEGYPTYQINWSQAGNIVTFTVNQGQSHASVPFFELPIPIQFKNATQDTILRVNHTFSGQTFTATIPFTADSLKFDPEWNIISANNNISSVNQIPQSKNEINIFPNPVSDQLQVNVTNLKGDATVEIFDLAGKKVSSQKMNFSSVNAIFVVDVRSLAKGEYQLSIINANKKITKPFIKSN